MLRVAYLEMTEPPSSIPPHAGTGSIAAEKLQPEQYLELYRRVGAPLRWDQRLNMPVAELQRLLESRECQVYVLRALAGEGEALGFCEFDRHGFPEIELKNFRLVPQTASVTNPPRISEALL